MKLISSELSYTALVAMSVEEQNKLLQSYANTGEKLKGLREDYSEAAKVAGKLICQIEARLERGKAAHVIPANRTVKEEYKAITGVAPTTHAYTYSKVFGGMVLSGKLPEKVYDENDGNPLYIAGQIQNAVLDLPEGNTLEHPAIAAACTELASASGKKKAANLKAILATVKPPAKLTAEEAIELAEEIAADGHMGMVLVHFADLFPNLSEEQRKSVFTTLAKDDGVMDRIGNAVGEKASEWLDAVNVRPNTSIKVIRAEVPAAPALQAA